MAMTRKELRRLIESAFDRRLTGPEERGGGPSAHQMRLDRAAGRRYAESDQKLIDDCKSHASYITSLYEPKFPAGGGEGMTLEEIRAELLEEGEFGPDEIAGTARVLEELAGLLRSMSSGE